MMLFEHMSSKYSVITADVAVAEKSNRSFGSILSWCKRQSISVDDCDYAVVATDRIVSSNGKYYDVQLNFNTRPLVEMNAEATRMVDDRLNSELRLLSDCGVKNGHILIYFEFLKFFSKPDADDLASSKKKNWLLTELFFRRLEDTARIAERLKSIDKFGPIVTIENNGNASFDYIGRVLINELIRRGVIRQSRR